MMLGRLKAANFIGVSPDEFEKMAAEPGFPAPHFTQQTNRLLKQWNSDDLIAYKEALIVFDNRLAQQFIRSKSIWSEYIS